MSNLKRGDYDRRIIRINQHQQWNNKLWRIANEEINVEKFVDVEDLDYLCTQILLEKRAKSFELRKL